MRLVQKGLWLAGVIIVHTSLWANAPSINDFKQLVRRLNHGENVSAVIHYKHCTLKKGGDHLSSNEGRFLSERFNFYNFVYKQWEKGNQLRQAIITSHETIMPARNGEFFRRYARLKLFDDNTVEIYSVTFTNTGSISQPGAPMIWHCQISQERDGCRLFVPPLPGPPDVRPLLFEPINE